MWAGAGQVFAIRVDVPRRPFRLLVGKPMRESFALSDRGRVASKGDALMPLLFRPRAAQRTRSDSGGAP